MALAAGRPFLQLCMRQALDAVDAHYPPKADPTTRGNLSLGSLPTVLRSFLATGNAHVVLGCPGQGMSDKREQWLLSVLGTFQMS